MKADAVLREKLAALPNVDILLSTTTVALQGNGSHISGLTLRDRVSSEEKSLSVDGVFLQIGLMPNSAFLSGAVETTKRGEIITDDRNRTSIPGVYAAGDVSTVPFKQIMIAMGDGAKASLAAFEDRIYHR